MTPDSYTMTMINFIFVLCLANYLYFWAKK